VIKNVQHSGVVFCRLGHLSALVLCFTNNDIAQYSGYAAGRAITKTVRNLMKTALPLALLLLLPATKPLTAENVVLASSAIYQTGSITVHIKGLKNPDGMLGFALYTTKRGFPDKPDCAFATRVCKNGSSSIDATFENIPYGSYAVSVLHDENSNGKMDKNFIGIPNEGFGVSNNPKIRRGPPSFSEALFSLDTSKLELSISMNYF